MAETDTTRLRPSVPRPEEEEEAEDGARGDDEFDVDGDGSGDRGGGRSRGDVAIGLQEVHLTTSSSSSFNASSSEDHGRHHHDHQVSSQNDDDDGGIVVFSAQQLDFATTGSGPPGSSSGHGPAHSTDGRRSTEGVGGGGVGTRTLNGGKGFASHYSQLDELHKRTGSGSLTSRWCQHCSKRRCIVCTTITYIITSAVLVVLMAVVLAYNRLLPFSSNASCPTASSSSAVLLPGPVLLLSFDGFRSDYLARSAGLTPNFDRLRAQGVYAQRLQSVFPSKTFPNHYSIVTGLYPESHGIVSNNMWDPVLGASFSITNLTAQLDPRWWGGEPLWVTANKWGLKTASMFWPGSTTSIQGITPDFSPFFDRTVDPNAIVDQVLSWLDLPLSGNQQPQLITFYVSPVDSAGHQYGPDSSIIDLTVQRMDQVLGRLISGLEQRDLWESVSLIVVSDHGMAELSDSRLIFLDDYIALSVVFVSEWSPVTAIWPAANISIASVYAALVNRHPNFHVVLKQDLPFPFHYQNNVRIAPILGLADDGWTVLFRSLFVPGFSVNGRGDHGYDPLLPDMGGLFVAHGPWFKPNVTVPLVKNIDLYNLMCWLLRIAPAPNNGTMDSVRQLLLPLTGTQPASSVAG